MEAKEFGICCNDCQAYGTCETKWSRGEKGEKDTCCKLCDSYDDCLIEAVKKKVRKKYGIN
jgi:hypothetical protein